MISYRALRVVVMTEHDAAQGSLPPARAVSIQIGEALWHARLRAGLPLEEIAQRIGVDPQTVLTSRIRTLSVCHCAMSTSPRFPSWAGASADSPATDSEH